MKSAVVAQRGEGEGKAARLRTLVQQEPMSKTNVGLSSAISTAFLGSCVCARAGGQQPHARKRKRVTTGYAPR